MVALRRFLIGLRALVSKKRAEADLDEELLDYIETAAEQKMASGMRRDEAVRLARIDLGSPESVKDQVRDIGWESRLEALGRDFQYTAGRLARSPGFTLVAALTLGLGIGANVAIFTLTYQVTIKPLPYKNPDQLVALWGDASYRGVPNSEISPANFRHWQQQATTLGDMTAYLQGTGMILDGTDGAERVDSRQVGANFFDVIGVAPAIGRGFLDEDDVEGANPVAVVSHTLWQRRFGGPEDLSGETLQTSRASYEVVGVMPRGFQFGAPNTDVWIPLILPESAWTDDRTGGFLLAAGRLGPGVSAIEAQVEMDTIAANLAAAFPEIDDRRGIRLTPLHEEFAGPVRTTYLILFAAAACVLFVACLNVANLLLLRGARRGPELALRRALGAGRSRLIQQLLTESALLAVLGSLVGLIVSQWTFGFLVRFVPTRMAGLTRLEVDAPVLAFALSVAVLTTVVAGLAPALKLSGLDVGRPVREGRHAGIGSRETRVRRALVVGEIAVAVVLLVCAGLLIATMNRLNGVDPGFEMSNLLTANVIRSTEVYDRVLERVTALPGVVDAGVGTTIPLTNYGGRRTIAIEGYVYDETDGQPRALWRAVGRGYLEALRVPLIEGQMFDRTERARTQPVALINDSMRRRYWGERNPIGGRVKRGGNDSDNPWMTVIGVVGDVKQAALDVDAEPELILPYLQDEGAAFYRPGSLVVRTSISPAALIETVRREIEVVDSSVPIEVRTMEQIASSGLADRRLRTRMVTGMAGLALVLSVLGVYALVSFAVADRTQEIGIRMALGACPQAIVRMVVKEGVALAVGGCAFGLLGAVAVTWTLESFLWGVTPTDPVSFVSVALLTVVVAVAASYLPARRITKINPVAALRYE